MVVTHGDVLMKEEKGYSAIFGPIWLRLLLTLVFVAPLYALVLGFYNAPDTGSHQLGDLMCIYTTVLTLSMLVAIWLQWRSDKRKFG
jgi:hypothetical protein